VAEPAIPGGSDDALWYTVLAMKPAAPLLPTDAPRSAAADPSLCSEIVRMCDARDDERITLPSIPTAEMLRLATPYPPPHDEPSQDTIPSPAPASARGADGARAEDAAPAPSPASIPGPPRVPRIAV
jgi:hypothetical protein